MNEGYIRLFSPGPPRPGRAELARIARLTLVGNSAGHQLSSPVDLSTKVSYLADGIYRFSYQSWNPAESQLYRLSFT